jgi:hypothetical protein
MAAYASTFRIPMYPPPPAGWEAHATDLNGRWYIPECRFTAGTGGSPDTLERTAIAYAAGITD